MNYEIKNATQKVHCPISSKEETVFIRYAVKDGNLVVAIPNGCESSYHKCEACDNCILQSLSDFKSNPQAH